MDDKKYNIFIVATIILIIGMSYLLITKKNKVDDNLKEEKIEYIFCCNIDNKLVSLEKKKENVTCIEENFKDAILLNGIYTCQKEEICTWEKEILEKSVTCENEDNVPNNPRDGDTYIGFANKKTKYQLTIEHSCTGSWNGGDYSDKYAEIYDTKEEAEDVAQKTYWDYEKTRCEEDMSFSSKIDEIVTCDKVKNTYRCSLDN